MAEERAKKSIVPLPIHGTAENRSLTLRDCNAFK